MEAEILKPFDLAYTDLLLMSSSSSSDLQRLESITKSMMEALGPEGPGLLCISGVTGAPSLRRMLLPLARRLALLPAHDRARVLKIHGLGTDVPLKNLDRLVSSFAMQLDYSMDASLEPTLNGSEHRCPKINGAKEEYEVNRCSDSRDDEFKMLGSTFRQLGLCMIDLGLRVARICDKALGSQELEQSILESRSAKGRLIHYHSSFDNNILKEIMKDAKGVKNREAMSQVEHLSAAARSGDGISRSLDSKVRDVKSSRDSFGKNCSMKSKVASHKTSPANLWQQWHYDYGIFTVLSTPMFLSSRGVLAKAFNACPCIMDDEECCSSEYHSCLQLFVPTKNKILLVEAPAESFIVQIGEAADILSKGKLRSTLHSVCRPRVLENISRETFVVFLQPTWQKRLIKPEYLTASQTCLDQSMEEGRNDACTPANNRGSFKSQGLEWLKEDILKSIPPLSSRLRDGMTFAEFSRETTRQYYGGGGSQSQK